MKRLLASSIIALVASAALAAAVAGQTPPAATPTTATQTPAQTPTSTSATQTPTATTPTATAAAPTPPAAAAGSMVVTALAPVPAGTTVRLEVLNVPSLRAVQCNQAATVADPSSSAASRVTFVVDQASCVAPNSGSLRICWSATECQVFPFEPGKTVDLGLLTTFVVQHPPSVGGGFDAPAAGPDALGRWLRWGAGTLFVLGVAGLLASGVLLRRRRPSGR